MPRFESRLLLVTDRQQTLGRPMLPLLEEVLRVGAPAVQLRERDLYSRELLSLARDVQQLTRRCASPLVINDRIDLALTLNDVGVHLRSNSLPVFAGRRVLGADRLLGVSAHSMEEVVRAESEGADYVVFGPIYATPSKELFGPPLGLRELETVCRNVRIPVVGIGGITAARVMEVRRAGAFGVAVITAILSAADVERATREMLDALASSL
ncbi:MAG: thiamine phosphate synthase [Nitrospira sp. CR1.3]|nr:thiamine phosphate synthase [Nitrospira sp. CR1.3]